MEIGLEELYNTEFRVCVRIRSSKDELCIDLAFISLTYRNLDSMQTLTNSAGKEPCRRRSYSIMHK